MLFYSISILPSYIIGFTVYIIIINVCVHLSHIIKITYLVTYLFIYLFTYRAN